MTVIRLRATFSQRFKDQFASLKMDSTHSTRTHSRYQIIHVQPFVSTVIQDLLLVVVYAKYISRVHLHLEKKAICSACVFTLLYNPFISRPPLTQP